MIARLHNGRDDEVAMKSIPMLASDNDYQQNGGRGGEQAEKR
jgi:hypothetical protein